MNKYKLVIFDWDGTLMDSVARIVSSMRAAALDVSLNLPSEEQVKAIIGINLYDAIDLLFPHENERNKQRVLKRYKTHYVELDSTPTPLFANASELLESLKSSGVKVAVATGKGREGLNRVLAQSDTAHFFNATICADESASKPAPDMLLSLLSEMNVHSHEAVMIGDTKHDLKMARNANVDSIGVTMGVDDENELTKYQPQAIVHSLIELEQILFA